MHYPPKTFSWVIEFSNNHPQQITEMDMATLIRGLIQSDSFIYSMLFYGEWRKINAAEDLGLANQLYTSGKLS